MKETQLIEYKETLKSGKIIQDIAMFANGDGGQIWIGYKNDGSFARQFIFDSASLDQFLNDLKFKIMPCVSSVTTEFIEREGLSDGIVIVVAKSFCNYHTVANQLWIRTGTIRFLASQEELEFRKLLGDGRDFTGQITSSTVPTIDDLEPKAIAKLRDKLLKNSKQILNLSTKDLLRSLGLIDKNDSPNLTCFLFLGKFDLRYQFLSSEIIRIAYLYEDERNGIEERFNVTIPWILNLDELFVEINKRNFTIEDIDLFRPTEKQYDPKAIEETVINAIAHRNWLIDSWIEIRHTPQKLIVYNPGIFKPNFENAIIGDKTQKYLNTTLHELLLNIGLMEKERRGIHKKIYKPQISKGLTIEMNQQSSKGGHIERVEFVLNGHIKNLEFAKLLYAKNRNMSFEQIQILDKIASGKNQFGFDISQQEFEYVSEYVSKGRGRSNVLKIKSFVDVAIPVFADASMNTIESLILDYAKEKHKSPNPEFSAKDIHNKLKTNKNTIYAILRKMIKTNKDGNTWLCQRKTGLYILNKPNKN